MLPTKIKNDIIEIKKLSNDYTYMKKNKEELQRIKTNVISIINSLDTYDNNAIVDLIFIYNEHIKDEVGILSSKYVIDTSEFYEKCADVRIRLRNFLNKIKRRINTLEIGVIEFTAEQKNDFYDLIEEYIENNNEVALEELLIEHIIDVNYIPHFDHHQLNQNNEILDNQNNEILDNQDDDEDSDDDFDDEDINVPLIIRACQNDNLNIVKMLYNNNANIDINISRPDGELDFTPLSAAIVHQNIDIVRFLLDNNVNLNLISENDNTPLKLAILMRNYPLLIEMIDNYQADINFPYDRKTPLHYACERRDIEAIKILLDRGANVNQRDINGNSALHRLISVFANNWEDAIKEIMDKFVNRGFEINSQNLNGDTVLHLLIDRRQNHNILSHWLSKGALIDLRNHFGRTPLDLAAGCGNIEIFNIINANHQ